MKQDELTLYKRALRDYRLSRFLPKVFFNTNFGFCCYFEYRHRQNNYNGLSSYNGLPPILRNIKPKKTYDGYWFPEGALKPRIELLKEAIKICETKKDETKS